MNDETPWQDIETAPKDVWIITWNGEEVQPMRWGKDHASPYDGWCFADHVWGGVLYEGVNEVDIEPTHWMPLPPPPNKEDSQ